MVRGWVQSDQHIEAALLAKKRIAHGKFFIVLTEL
jgi:hypothetical protein